MLTYQHQVTLTRLLQEYLVDLCREYLPFGNNLAIDGVVCLANGNDLAQQLVLKVHHKLANNKPVADMKPTLHFPQDSLQVQWPATWTSLYDTPQDLTVKDSSKSEASLASESVKTSHKPAALQPTKPAVTSLLYQKIMEGSGKQGNSSVKHELAEEDSDSSSHKEEMLCKICSQTVFGGFAALQNHTYEVHRRYVCKKCYSTFSLRCNLRRHERLHEGLKPYSCDSCDKTFSRSTDLRMHMQKHAGIAAGSVESNMQTDNSAIVCDKCNKSFSSVQNLRWHMYKLHKAQDEVWVCSICEQLFQDKESYEQHKDTHTASLSKYKRPRLDTEEEEEAQNDDQVMRDEYQEELRAIDDEAALKLTEVDDSSNEARVTPHPFPSIKQALASKSPTPGISARNKRKGNPMKHIVNVSDSEEEQTFESISYGMPVETVNPGSTASPAPSVESENDPLQNSYNSDVLASSSISQYSRFSEFDHPSEHLQSLQTLSQIRSPLVIKPDNNLSPLSLPRSSAVLFSSSPLCQSPASFQAPNMTYEDIPTPERSLEATPQAVDDGDDDKEYTCSYDSCTEVCHGFRAFESHCVSVHSRYPCKLCKQTFSGKNNRTRHIRNHNRAKIYPCPDCGKYFSRPDSMREHRFIHTASYQEDKCRRCHQEFQRKSLLLAHLKTCFRSARSKNGCIDETPYLQNGAKNELNLSTQADNEGAGRITESIPTVKNENNNDTVLAPHAVELANVIKNSAVLAAAAAAAVPKIDATIPDKSLDLNSVEEKCAEGDGPLLAVDMSA